MAPFFYCNKMIINDLLNQGIKSLGDKPSASLDVEVVLSHVLGEDRGFLFMNPNFNVSDELACLFLNYIGRIGSGEPVAYITNLKEFYGLDFFVDDRVLIPRPETEEIVTKVLKFLDESCNSSLRILDVGTGSGNIPVAIAASFDMDRDILIDAVDISENALQVAQLNIETHCVEDRVHVFQGDLLEVIDEGEEYDVIVANLPYIGEIENRFVSPETEKYEPNLALFAGVDGLSLYEGMFQEMVDKSLKYGLLIGEFGAGQRESMGKLLEKYFPERWSIENDLAGIERVFIVLPLL